MNQAYKLVWDEMRRMLVIVAENSRARGKRPGVGGALLPAFALAALTLCPEAGTLTGGRGEAWAMVCQLVDSNGNPINTGATATSDNRSGDGADNAIACGIKAVSGGQMGNGTNNTERTIAIGNRTSVLGDWGIAIGAGAQVMKGYNAGSQGGVAIGGLSKANANQGVGIGMGAEARAEQSVAVGANTIAQGASSIAIGGDDVGYYGIDPNAALYSGYKAVDDFQDALKQRGIDVPESISNITAYMEVNGQKIAKTTDGKVNGPKYAYLDTTTAEGPASVAVGVKAVSTGALSAAYGMGARSQGEASMAVGTASHAAGNYASAVGTGSYAGGQYSSAVGMGSRAEGEDNVALGSWSKADRQADEAILQNKAGVTSTTGYDVLDNAAFSGVSSNSATWTPTLAAVSVGSGEVPLYCKGATGCAEQTTDPNLSTGSNAPRKAYKDSAGNWTDQALDSDANANIMQYTSTTRRITNLAAGAADTDAVNVAQLKRVQESSWKVGGNLVQDANGDIIGSDGNKYKYDGNGPYNIAQGDVVNFVDGDGTTAVTSNKTIVGYDSNGDPITINHPSVTYNVNKTPVQPNSDTGTAYGWCADENCNTKLTWDGEKFLDPTDPTKRYDGPVYTIGVNGQPGTKVDAAAPTKQYVTAGDVVNTINNTYWTATDGTTDAPVKAGNTVTFQGATVEGSTVTTTGSGIVVKNTVDDDGNPFVNISVDKNKTAPTAPNGSITGGLPNKYWDSQQTQDAINSAYWNVHGYNGSTPAQTNAAPVKAGDTVKVVAGTGLHLAQSDKELTLQGTTASQTTNTDGTKNTTISVVNPDGSRTNYTIGPHVDQTLTTIGVGHNDGKLTGPTDTNDPDYNRPVSAGSVVEAVNNTYWTALDENGKEIQVTPSTDVTFKGGDGASVTVDPNGSITFDVNKNQIGPRSTYDSTTNTGGTITGGTANQYWDSLQVQQAVNSAGWNMIGGTGVTTGSTANISAGNNVTIASDGTVNITQTTATDGTTFTFGVDGSTIAGGGNFTHGDGTTYVYDNVTKTGTFNVNEGSLKVTPGSVTTHVGGTPTDTNQIQPNDPNKYYTTAGTVAQAIEDAAQKYRGDTGSLVEPGVGGTLPIRGWSAEKDAAGNYLTAAPTSNWISPPITGGYSGYNLQVVPSGNGGLGVQMSENPTFRDQYGRPTVQISGDQGTVTAAKTVTAGGVTMGNQTPPSSSYVGNGGPNPATGNYVTGLENKSWTNGNYVSGRAATEDQLQQVAQSLDLSFSGDRNIWVNRSGNHVSIRLNPNVHVDSVTVNDGVYVVDGPSMTKQGINAAGTTITNVAPGIQETDAVNVGQLRRLEHKVNKMGDRADAGIAGAMAAAAVPQVTVPGANLLGAGAGYFHDQSAVAVGYSAMSDNGKWILKANASVSTEEAAASAGVGYQW